MKDIMPWRLVGIDEYKALCAPIKCPICEMLKEKRMAKIDQQIQLLHESVEKWHKGINERIPIGGSIDCPLCRKYHIEGECNGCPLHEQGEEFYCFNDGIYARFVEKPTLEHAEEMVNMLEYMVDLYEIKKVHDNS